MCTTATSSGTVSDLGDHTYMQVKRYTFNKFVEGATLKMHAEYTYMLTQTYIDHKYGRYLI